MANTQGLGAAIAETWSLSPPFPICRGRRLSMAKKKVVECPTCKVKPQRVLTDKGKAKGSLFVHRTETGTVYGSEMYPGRKTGDLVKDVLTLTGHFVKE